MKCYKIDQILIIHWAKKTVFKSIGFEAKQLDSASIALMAILIVASIGENIFLGMECNGKSGRLGLNGGHTFTRFDEADVDEIVYK